MQPAPAPAVARRNAQLPGFAPLLDELEIAGWSSHRRLLSGNFHDWLLLEGRGVLVTVGQAVGPDPHDLTEAALVAQAAWAAIRAHAYHTSDAGTLLSRASRSLWPIPNSRLQASVAVALIDSAEGHASVAMAGDCLAWKVRAATSELLTICQPPLGGAAEFAYISQSVQLSLLERLLLVADDPMQRSPKLAASIAASFAQLDAESHRRMIAADAVALVRRHYELPADEIQSPASIVAVRRR
ncbi:MAG: SpoIIE family protein phosphatase [Pirellulales bacterium]